MVLLRMAIRMLKLIFLWLLNKRGGVFFKNTFKKEVCNASPFFVFNLLILKQ